MSEESWTDKYGVLKDMTKVYSNSVNRELTRDFTMAKLEEKDRVMIEGLVSMAFFTKRAIEDVKLKPRYIWDSKEKAWKLTKMSEAVMKIVDKYAKDTYDLLMGKPHVIAILKRNMKDNWIVKLIGERVREEEKLEQAQEVMEEKESLKSRLLENKEEKSG